MFFLIFDGETKETGNIKVTVTGTPPPEEIVPTPES